MPGRLDPSWVPEDPNRLGGRRGDIQGQPDKSRRPPSPDKGALLREPGRGRWAQAQRALRWKKTSLHWSVSGDELEQVDASLREMAVWYVRRSQGFGDKINVADTFFSQTV